MKKKLQLGGRVVVYIVLLSFVCKNAHWAVTLSLTSTMIGIEILTQTQLLLIGKLKEIVEELRGIANRGDG